MTEIEQRAANLLQIAVSKGFNEKNIQKALDLAFKLHSSTLRKSGEPYIIHPLAVAELILELDIGENAVIAALLHDVLEDCDITEEQIKAELNPKVAELVTGVTKINEYADNSLKRYSEIQSLRKFLISFAKDVRVLLIKLADRLHNMRTIDALSPQRQIEYSEETLKVYAPLAEYTGINKWKRELEDIAFQKKSPEIYNKIQELVYEDKAKYESILESLIKEIKLFISKADLPLDKVFGRIKSISSIYNKFLKYLEEGRVNSIDTFNFKTIKDYLALSIVLDASTIECYHALGILHSKFPHSQGDFKDYIAKPRSNGYNSIHTVVKYKNVNIEVQIKTSEMHFINEFGPASHIAYKLSRKRNASLSEEFTWVKELNDWKEKDEKNYTIKAFSDKIFAISPKGKVVELKKGSTPIDFAYAIHSSVGNRYAGAKANGKIVKLNYEIQNGDIVEILTSKNPKYPNLDWLKTAASPSTRNKIRRYIREQEKELIITHARNDLSKYIDQAIKIDWLHLDSETLNFILNETSCKDIETFYSKIYHGSLPKIEILKLLVKKLNLQRAKKLPAKQKQASNSRIIVEGIEDLDYKIAGCCQPKSPDEIIGIVTLRDGLKIHKKNCRELKEYPESRILKANWR